MDIWTNKNLEIRLNVNWILIYLIYYFSLDGKYDDFTWKNAIGKSEKSSETIGCEWIANWRHSISIEHIFALQRKEKERSNKMKSVAICWILKKKWKDNGFIYIGIYLYVIIMSTLVKYKQQRVPSF